jgi:hypothetical protein
MANLLKDLLPGAPSESSLIVAAAQADLAGALRGHVAQGMDPRTAIRLTAGSFADSTSHNPEACVWVVNEFALALGIDALAPAQPATVPPPTNAEPTVQAPVPLPGWSASGQPVADELWQPPGWAAPPRRPASPSAPTAKLAGILALAGAFLVLLGSAVPWLRYAGVGGQSVSLFSGFRGNPGSETFWFASEPVAVLIAAVVLGIMLLARRRSAAVPGMLTAFGIQTTLLFGGYVFAVYPPAHHGAGGGLGLLGGLALLAAGLAGLSAARQGRSG